MLLRPLVLASDGGSKMVHLARYLEDYSTTVTSAPYSEVTIEIQVASQEFSGVIPLVYTTVPPEPTSASDDAASVSSQPSSLLMPLNMTASGATSGPYPSTGASSLIFYHSPSPPTSTATIIPFTGSGSRLRPVFTALAMLFLMGLQAEIA